MFAEAIMQKGKPNPIFYNLKGKAKFQEIMLKCMYNRHFKSHYKRMQFTFSDYLEISLLYLGYGLGKQNFVIMILHFPMYSRAKGKLKVMNEYKNMKRQSTP